MFSNRPRAGVLSYILLSVLSLTAAGCASKSDLADVTGVVMLDGKPMPEALVEFLPDSDKGTHGWCPHTVAELQGVFYNSNEALSTNLMLCCGIAHGRP